MDERFDPGGAQRSLHGLPHSAPHGKQVVDVAGIALDDRTDSGMERTAVPERELAAALGPFAEERQTRAENGRLHLVEPAVDARLAVHVAIGLASVTQPFEAIRH